MKAKINAVRNYVVLYIITKAAITRVATVVSWPLSVAHGLSTEHPDEFVVMVHPRHTERTEVLANIYRDGQFLGTAFEHGDTGWASNNFNYALLLETFGPRGAKAKVRPETVELVEA